MQETNRRNGVDIADMTVQEKEHFGVTVSPQEYPKWKRGQKVVLDGFEFELKRFNTSSIVLVPMSTTHFDGARYIMPHLQQGRVDYDS